MTCCQPPVGRGFDLRWSAEYQGCSPLLDDVAAIERGTALGKPAPPTEPPSFPVERDFGRSVAPPQEAVKRFPRQPMLRGTRLPLVVQLARRDSEVLGLPRVECSDLRGPRT